MLWHLQLGVQSLSQSRERDRNRERFHWDTAGKNPFQAGLLLRAEQVFLYHSKQLLWLWKWREKKIIICPMETNLWCLHFIYGKITQQGQWGIGLQAAPAPLMSNLLINSSGNAARVIAAHTDLAQLLGRNSPRQAELLGEQGDLVLPLPVSSAGQKISDLVSVLKYRSLFLYCWHQESEIHEIFSSWKSALTSY